MTARKFYRSIIIWAARHYVRALRTTNVDIHTPGLYLSVVVTGEWAGKRITYSQLTAGKAWFDA